ncbi:MAG: hypothetical protein II325_03385 [Clostridia bacterium]|nr:hypothetical protein [Clostridia bacterium]
MKKRLLTLFAAMAVLVCMLAACAGETVDTSSPDTSSAAVSIEESSVPEEISRVESSAEENSQAEPEIPEDAVELLFARYTSKPSFVMIGTCAQGAEITAQIGGQSVTVPSYMGWFTVTMKAEGGDNQEITFIQTIDGEEYDIPRTFKTRVRTPANKGNGGMGSNKAYQFFLTNMLPDFTRTATLYNSTQLDNMVSRVKDRLAQMHAYNPEAEIIYMIVPSPMTIYPELAPEEYKPGVGISRRELVMTKLKAAGATVIDLKDLFMEHKNDEMPLYYHLDSHWADYGAYLAYTALFEHIAEKFPAAAPKGMDAFTWTADYYTSADAMLFLDIPQVEVKEYGYLREFKETINSQITDIPRYRGMQLIYSEECTAEFRIDTNREELPSCIVHRDSYSAAIFDLIPERMDYTHYMGMWSYGWNSAYVNSEKPDYVIYLVAEWNVGELVSR